MSGRKYPAASHIILAATLVYIVLNLVENMIHFSIGRSVDAQREAGFRMHLPTPYDFAKITGIMLVFATLQGVLTYVVSRHV